MVMENPLGERLFSTSKARLKSSSVKTWHIDNIKVAAIRIRPVYGALSLIDGVREPCDHRLACHSIN